MTAPQHLIAIGASLGGLRALGVVLGQFPQDYAGAVVVAQHRRADYDSTFAMLLGRECPLPVVEPDDKTALRRGVVYLAPAGYHLLVESRSLVLSVDEPINYARPSIDVLFESAARAFRRDVTGVLLTGASVDGAQGLVEIRRLGGRTLVQDPAEAESPIAPQSALDRGAADTVMTLTELARTLASISVDGSPTDAECTRK